MAVRGREGTGREGKGKEKGKENSFFLEGSSGKCSQ